MKRLALSLLLLTLAPSLRAESFAPTLPDVENFAGIWKRSPFIVETVAVPVNAGLAAKFALVGSFALQGTPVVVLTDRTNPDPAKNRLLVRQGTSNPAGIEIISLSDDPDPRKKSVVLRQAGQQATITFDANLLAQSSAPGPEAGAVPPPGIPRPNVVPNPGVPPAGVVPGANPAATPPPAVRRIIRPGSINVP